MTRPSLGRLTRAFVRIGNTTFGGGDTTMAALQREFIDRRGWITQEDYAVAFSLARITPGTNVVAFCAAVGRHASAARGNSSGDRGDGGVAAFGVLAVGARRHPRRVLARDRHGRIRNPGLHQGRFGVGDVGSGTIGTAGEARLSDTAS
jgi:hypothetical protein